MNWDSCEVPKNSLIAATTGRMLIRVCGVIASTSWVVMRSRTTRSMRDRPVRIWFSISSPTARMRRLPKWSMSSISTRTSTGSPSRVPLMAVSPACSAAMKCTIWTMSSSVSTDALGSPRCTSTPSLRLSL